MACDDDITQVEVEAWTVGVAIRLIQLQGKNISKTCPGIQVTLKSPLLTLYAIVPLQTAIADRDHGFC